MRKLIPALALIAIAFAVAPWAQAETITVQITKAGFSPATLNAAVGDTVTFKNADTAAHQVAADNGAFRSPVIQPGRSASQTLSTPGTIPYHDTMHPAFKGTLQVFARQVSIDADKRSVVFGSKVRLSGNISSGEAGQQVLVRRRLCGGDDFAYVGSFLTQAGGLWFLRPAPLNNTEYKVIWNEAEDTVTVNVRPQLQLGVLGRGHFVIKAVAFAQPYRGRYVWVQRFVPKQHSWRNVKRAFFRTVRAGSHGNRISSVAFRARIGHGFYLRAVMPKSQVGECYIAGISNTVRS
jgi:plastocyanin